VHRQAEESEEEPNPNGYKKLTAAAIAATAAAGHRQTKGRIPPLSHLMPVRPPGARDGKRSRGVPASTSSPPWPSCYRWWNRQRTKNKEKKGRSSSPAKCWERSSPSTLGVWGLLRISGGVEKKKREAPPSRRRGGLAVAGVAPATGAQGFLSIVAGERETEQGGESD
jgi:hypothetical protein